MKKELLKKMKYDMPKGPKGEAPEGAEIEISLGEESEELGGPKMPGEMEDEMMAEEMDMEEPEALDLSLASDEELMAELKKRKAKPAMA
jgi:hypothetical protein